MQYPFFLTVFLINLAIYNQLIKKTKNLNSNYKFSFKNR